MLKKIIFLVISCIVLLGCSDKSKRKKVLHFKMENLQARTSEQMSYSESIYVPIYTDVYHIDQSRLFPLTVTLSLRNTSVKDTVFVFDVDYFNSQGKLIKEHIDEQSMLVLGPLESYDLVIEKLTFKGDTGANYLVKYGQKNGTENMLVQALMINTSGQQGLSFITNGIRIESEEIQL